MAGNGREKFTYEYYKHFVCRLREACRLTTFLEGKRIVDKSDEPLLILRHDIDMDLKAALRMSSIEKDLGIQSTYFFMLSCPLYNVFGSDGAEQVRQLLAGGHHFGLHFDCAVYEDICADNLGYYVSRECDLLERFFDQPIEAVSFHRPGSLELSGVQLEKLPNSYEMVFREKFQYFSDSRGEWGRGDPIDSEAFTNRKNFHLCIHPIWWTVEPKTPYECLVDLVRRIGDRSDRYLSENCQVWAEGGQESRGTLLR